MLTPELHPWQEGPVGLLRFARNTSRSADQLHQLIAFLILDICVETTMRTFLSLPDDIAPAKIKYFERRKFSEGTFHHLTRGLEAACATPLVPTDLLRHVKYFHDKRNQLYHQGGGITVAAGDVERYMRVAASLLHQLLGVEQEGAPTSPGGTSSPTVEQVARLGAELPRHIEQFRGLINALFETIEPRLVYPTTISRLSTIATGIDAVSFPRKLTDFRQLIESTIKDREIKTWLMDLLADDIAVDSEQTLENSQFLMEACVLPESDQEVGPRRVRGAVHPHAGSPARGRGVQGLSPRKAKTRGRSIERVSRTPQDVRDCGAHLADDDVVGPVAQRVPDKVRDRDPLVAKAARLETQFNSSSVKARPPKRWMVSAPLGAASGLQMATREPSASRASRSGVVAESGPRGRASGWRPGPRRPCKGVSKASTAKILTDQGSQRQSLGGLKCSMVTHMKRRVCAGNLTGVLAS